MRWARCIEELGTYIKMHKEEIVRSLLDGRYQPRAVKGVEIPKPKGGARPRDHELLNSEL